MGYGYEAYGYSAYGDHAAGDDGDGYGGYYSYYGPFPDAALHLNGPGSSAYVGRPYSSSYAYETQAGGIYTHLTAHTSAGYVDDRSYTFSNDTYKLTQSTSYENFQDRSGPSYGYGFGYGYYSSYAPPSAYTEHTFTQTQNVVGGITYFDTTGSSSTATTTGYIYSSYTHQTSEAVDGHPVTGAGYAYFASSITNPYGYSAYASHTSTF